MNTERVTPFSNGSQASDWEDANCPECVNSDDFGNKKPCLCGILYALTDAYFGDGTVTREIWERMGGHFWQGRYIWPCAEFRDKETGEPWSEYAERLEEVLG